MPRLNDTKALTSRPMEPGTERSISVRKIDNGFLVRESSCNPKTGEYRSTERFSENEPTSPDGGSGPDRGLRGAMDYLNNDK